MGYTLVSSLCRSDEFSTRVRGISQVMKLFFQYAGHALKNWYDTTNVA